MNNVSALARSPFGKRLLQFIKDNELTASWDNTGNHNITAMVTGFRFSSENPSQEIINGGMNDEVLVHLRSPISGRSVFNLHLLLVLAAAYVRDQYDSFDAPPIDTPTAPIDNLSNQETP